MKKTIASLMLAPVLLAGGCQKSGTSPGGVAVIDLDRVATAMGWLDDLSKNLQSADTELRTQLDQVWRANVTAIEELKKQVAADAKLTPEQIKLLDTIQDPRDLSQLPLTKEQREKLVATVTQANANWQQALNNSQQLLQNRRRDLILSYRERVRPFARRVATARGMTVVLLTTDNLLLSEPQADITDGVIDELQKSLAEARASVPVTAGTPAVVPGTPAPSTTGLGNR
jgi:Skp family chaperone for outer membrane proteins